MITSIKTFIVYAWNFVFNHNVSPLRHIPSLWYLRSHNVCGLVSTSIGIDIIPNDQLWNSEIRPPQIASRLSAA